MDWSKSKTIFIVVFFILDVFLISLYLNRQLEAQQVKVPGEKTIEARLKEDNITFAMMPPNTETASFLSAKVANFNEEDLPTGNFQNITIKNNDKLVVTLKEPVKIKSVSEQASYNEFLKNYVLNGTSYSLRKVDELNRTATFFQKVDQKVIYYNIHGVLTIHWNEDHEITMYEQSMLVDFEKYEEGENLLSPLQIVQILYARNLLKPDSQITEMNIGYSTLVQLTEAQVFVPTWEVRVKTAGDEEEEFFVNAVDGKIIDVQSDLTVDEDDTEELEKLTEIEGE